MTYLLLVSLIWAFSFGLIKGNLTGIDSNFVSFARLLISFVVFLPFIKIKNVSKSTALKLVFTGAVQYGIMYSFYIYSYQFLQAYQVALFTIFTPLFVTLINDIFNKKINYTFLFSAVSAITGTAVIVYSEFKLNEVITGFFIVQASNVCFAFGQIYYKKIMSEMPRVKDSSIYSLLFAGAFLVTGMFSLFTTDYSTLALTSKQFLTLLYLGAVASGVGFFLWNYGVRKTDTGALAVFNNFKIPLAIIVSLIFFDETTDILKLTIGCLIILSGLVYNEYKLKPASCK